MQVIYLTQKYSWKPQEKNSDCEMLSNGKSIPFQNSEPSPAWKADFFLFFPLKGSASSYSFRTLFSIPGMIIFEVVYFLMLPSRSPKPHLFINQINCLFHPKVEQVMIYK